MKKNKKSARVISEEEGHILNVPVYEDQGGSWGLFFYCFVICNATKNVHGNYKQTKSIKRKKKKKKTPFGRMLSSPLHSALRVYTRHMKHH